MRSWINLDENVNFQNYSRAMTNNIYLLWPHKGHIIIKLSTNLHFPKCRRKECSQKLILASSQDGSMNKHSACLLPQPHQNCY